MGENGSLYTEIFLLHKGVFFMQQFFKPRRGDV